MCFSLAVCALSLLVAPETQAQLSAVGPIIYSHHHIYASSMAEQKRFWVDTLGRRDAGPLGAAPMDVILFPHVQVIISVQKPMGGTVGTIVNHVAFQVPAEKMEEYRDRLRAAGVETTEIANHDDSEFGLSEEWTPETFVRSLYFLDPDGILLEFAAWTKDFGPTDVTHTPNTAADRNPR